MARTSCEKRTMGKYITDAEAHLTLIYIVVMLAILGVGVWRHGKEAILHVLPAFLAGLLGVTTFASKLSKAVTAGTTTATKTRSNTQEYQHHERSRPSLSANTRYQQQEEAT